MIELTREDILRGHVDVPVETMTGEALTLRVTRLTRRQVEAIQSDDLMESVLQQSVQGQLPALDELTFESAARLKRAAWILSVAGLGGQKKAKEAAEKAAAVASSNFSAPSAS